MGGVEDGSAGLCVAAKALDLKGKVAAQRTRGKTDPQILTDIEDDGVRNDGGRARGAG